MKVTLQSDGTVLCVASDQLLSNNIEAYENTIPSMLSDRLRNPKFAGPENVQTGIAAEWEPIGNGMTGLSCRLIPGMYLSGTESQSLHNYAEGGWSGILQAGVQVFAGEELEVEMWARARHRPVEIKVELQASGLPPYASQSILFDLAHWTRRTARLTCPVTHPNVFFKIMIPGDSLIDIDQVHLRPVGEPHVAQALLESFDQFPCPVLRFPGGCVSCTYHWEHGVGPVHLRPVQDDPVFKYKLHYDFGTDEYLELCAARNIRPLITLNTTTATPEQAAAWAAYIRTWYVRHNLAVPAAYFMFGNENYGTWEIGHMTGEMYAAQLREFVPPVRVAYPEARIRAIGEFDSGGLRPQHATPWRSVVMEKAADLFDVLVVTRYCGCGDQSPIGDIMKAVADSVAGKAADLERMARSIRDSGLKKTMGIVEWNFWSRASHNDHAGFYEPNDIRHCLFSAGHLNAFCRQGELLELACFYSLVNTMGMLQVKHGRVQLSDLVKVFNLYADALPGQVLKIAVDAPMLTEHSKAVDANFVRKGTTTFGFLVNFSATETADVSLAGLGPVREATGLTARNILEPVTTVAVSTSGSTVSLPPMSLVRVRV